MRVNLRFDASNTLARNFTLESSNRKKKPLKNLLGKKRVKLCVLLSLFLVGSLATFFDYLPIFDYYLLPITFARAALYTGLTRKALKDARDSPFRIRSLKFRKTTAPTSGVAKWRFIGPLRFSMLVRECIQRFRKTNISPVNSGHKQITRDTVPSIILHGKWKNGCMATVAIFELTRRLYLYLMMHRTHRQHCVCFNGWHANFVNG